MADQGSYIRDLHRSRLFEIALGITICTGLYYSSSYAYNYLADVRRSARITPRPETPPDFFTAATEDSIREDTIATLLQSPNPDMANAARRLTIERVMRHRNAFTTLLGNIRGNKGRELQEQGLTSLKYLYAQGQHFPKREQMWTALVVAMRSYLPRQGPREFDPDNAWKLRSQGERDGLYLLGYELDSHVVEIIQSTNLIRLWLADYPFAGFNSSDRSRQDFVEKLFHNQSEDDLLARVLSALHRCPLGRKELRYCKLLGSEILEANMNDDGIASGSADLPHIFDDENAEVRMPPESPRQNGDPLESAEDSDARRRRRRRNAMVIDNGGEVDAEPSESEGPD